MNMLDHIGIGVTDYGKSKAFYDLALAPLGIIKVMEVTAAETGHSDAAGYGADRPFFWFGRADQVTPVHVAFTVKDRSIVDAFFKAALAAGGKDNGAPGLRPHYHADYYGAFVLDPDGHNIEAVCHTPA
jgi:catechol 2,3-dioxygenase-like lactoylglutathione lyase family enzyme